jgi:large repetitive protein
MLKAFYSLSFVVIIFSISLIGACSSEDVEREPECDGSLTISLDGAPVNPTTCSSTNGSVTVTAVGGTAPYQYSVNGGALQSSSTFSNLSQGTYTFTVIDKNDCEDVIEGISIEAPGSTLDLSANVTPDTNCSANNGTITLTGSGGNGTLTYRMGTDGFSASNQYQGLGPGN